MIDNKGFEAKASVSLTDKGPQLSFHKDCLDRVEIYRRTGESDWKIIAMNVRSPYTDEQVKRAGKISYMVNFIHKDGTQEQEEMEVNF